MYGSRAGIKIWIQIRSLYSKNMLYGLTELIMLLLIIYSIFYQSINWNVTSELISTNENCVSTYINITAYKYLTSDKRTEYQQPESSTWIKKWTRQNCLHNYKMPGWFNLSTFWLENSCILVHCIKLNWYNHKVSDEPAALLDATHYKKGRLLKDKQLFQALSKNLIQIKQLMATFSAKTSSTSLRSKHKDNYWL